MRTRDLFCALAVWTMPAAFAQDCLPWQEAPKPAGAAAEEAARRYLRAAARERPADAAWHARTGRLLFESQCYELAMSELLRARRLGENNAEFLLRLASVENILGAFGDAAADADAAAPLPPGSPAQRASAAALAGVAYRGAEQPDLAIARFRQALEFAPESENSAIMLAELLVEKGLSGDAAAVLEKFLARSPSAVEPWAQLGRLHLAAKNTARAIDCWTRVRRLNPEYPMADTMLAQAMSAQEAPDWQAVLKVLERARRKTPEDSDIFYLEGKALAQLKQYAGAARAFETAIRLRPLESSLYYQLGQVYQKLGRADLARKQFETMAHLRARQEGQ